ncbi:MAG: helix-turn-helix transcriptional regulator [Phycisphaerales bacterium]|nr:helix-turn-helix transcriptional regulator [Phycisphaerales bacterium]
MRVVGDRSYRELGEATGHSSETVRRYMQGQTPSVEFVAALCARLDINPHWLLTGQGPVRHSESRPFHLREANPAELLTAVAAALERLTARVDTLEHSLRALEARTAAPDGYGGSGDRPVSPPERGAIGRGLAPAADPGRRS